MKKAMLMIILMTSICYAAPGDVPITITIPSEHVATARVQFLAVYPVDQIANPAYIADPNQPMFINEYTDEQWFEESVRRWFLKILRKGKIKLATKPQTIDPNTVQ